jgi:antibiotic biosynthesis monooxygenase (ABM) superfamily enzyme
MMTETPAKTVIERHVPPGAGAQFQDWAERLIVSARQSGGHQGSSVLSAGDSARFILVRFANQSALERWRDSADHAALMREGAAFGSGQDITQTRSGLETWFTLPDMPAPAAPPPKWKMALLTWLCLMPLVIAADFLTAPLRLPLLINVAVNTAIPVCMLTWLIMPRLTRALYRWLYPSSLHRSKYVQEHA